MTNKDVHVELNEMLFALVKKQQEHETEKRSRQIEALKEGCKAIRERDQMKLF